MKYSCGHKADLRYITKDQVRSTRWCRDCDPSRAEQRAADRRALREAAQRNLETQASLDKIGMGQYGPTAVTDGERIGFIGTSTAKTVLTTLVMMGALHQADTVAKVEMARRRREAKP